MTIKTRWSHPYRFSPPENEKAGIKDYSEIGNQPIQFGSTSHRLCSLLTWRYFGRNMTAEKIVVEKEHFYTEAFGDLLRNGEVNRHTIGRSIGMFIRYNTSTTRKKTGHKPRRSFYEIVPIDLKHAIMCQTSLWLPGKLEEFFEMPMNDEDCLSGIEALMKLVMEDKISKVIRDLKELEIRGIF